MRWREKWRGRMERTGLHRHWGGGGGGGDREEGVALTRPLKVLSDSLWVVWLILVHIWYGHRIIIRLVLLLKIRCRLTYRN